MKGPYIFTALLLAASQAANAGSYRDTAKRPSDTVKVEDCGKNICAMISFGGHKFVVKDSDIAKALKDVGYKGDVVIESFTTDVKVIARAAAIWRRIEPTRNEIAVNGLKFLRKTLG